MKIRKVNVLVALALVWGMGTVVHNEGVKAVSPAECRAACWAAYDKSTGNLDKRMVDKNNCLAQCGW
jgi:hypothetical protein